MNLKLKPKILQQLKFWYLEYMSYFNFCDQESDALPTELSVLPLLKISTTVKYMYICFYIYRANDKRYCYDPYFLDRQTYAKSVDSDQTAPRGEVL